jgi:arylsulfatase
MPAWDSIPEDERPFQRRLMEVAAGFTEHVDVQVGRIIDELDALGYGENTLIFYIWGDNGSSAEGQDGTISELLAQNGIPTTARQHITALDGLGGLDALGTALTDNIARRLGLGREHAVQKGRSSGLALRRHATRWRSAGRRMPDEATRAVSPLQRHCPNDLPGYWHQPAADRRRCRAGSDWRTWRTFDDPGAEGQLRAQ